jgi:hypothetical protein
MHLPHSIDTIWSAFRASGKPSTCQRVVRMGQVQWHTMTHHIMARYDGHLYTAMHCTCIKKSVDDNMVHHIIKMLSDQMVMCRMGSMCMATRLSWLYGLSTINAPDRYISVTVAKMAKSIRCECPS